VIHAKSLAYSASECRFFRANGPLLWLADVTTDGLSHRRSMVIASQNQRQTVSHRLV
jgi:hypothetical protein